MKPLFFLCALTWLAVDARAQDGGTDALPPDARTICAEARANILRARLTHVQKPMQDSAVVSKIFALENHNEYHIELRPKDEWRKLYPQIWLQSFYAIANSGVLQEPRIHHSAGDEIPVYGTVEGIEFVEWPQDAAVQPPGCKIGIKIDWSRAEKP